MFPIPKFNHFWEALFTQRPDIIAMIPMMDETHYFGICYAVSSNGGIDHVMESGWSDKSFE